MTGEPTARRVVQSLEADPPELKIAEEVLALRRARVPGRHRPGAPGTTMSVGELAHRPGEGVGRHARGGRRLLRLGGVGLCGDGRRGGAPPPLFRPGADPKVWI